MDSRRRVFTAKCCGAQKTRSVGCSCAASQAQDAGRNFLLKKSAEPSELAYIGNG